MKQKAENMSVSVQWNGRMPFSETPGVALKSIAGDGNIILQVKEMTNKQRVKEQLLLSPPN